MHYIFAIYSLFVPWWIGDFIVKFLKDKLNYRKRRAKISTGISACLFRVTCNKVSSIYSLYVHYIFTIYSLYIQYIFTLFSLYIHYMFTIYSVYILYICHDEYVTLLSNSWKSSWNIAKNEQKYQPVFLLVFSVSRVTKSQVYIHYMFTIYSVYIHYIITIYSLYIHYIFTIYSLHVDCLFIIYFLYIPWWISDFIVKFLKDKLKYRK